MKYRWEKVFERRSLVLNCKKYIEGSNVISTEWVCNFYVSFFK